MTDMGRLLEELESLREEVTEGRDKISDLLYENFELKKQIRDFEKMLSEYCRLKSTCAELHAKVKNTEVENVELKRHISELKSADLIT